MRTLWNTLSFLAVINLLGLTLFTAWLWQSGRLNADRLRSVRDLLAPTVAEAAAAEAAALEQAQAEAQEAQEVARRENPPLASARQIAYLDQDAELAAHSRRRLEASKEQLLEQLDRTMAQLDAKEQELAALRAEWDASTRTERERNSDVQFQKTVKLYESLDSKQAKGMLLDLVEAGNMDQAVAYLNAMSTRPATKIISELSSDVERPLATELLERLRTFGTLAEAEVISDDERIASQSANDTPPQH